MEQRQLAGFMAPRSDVRVVSLQPLGPPRPFTFTWSGEGAAVDEPPGAGDYLASVNRRTGELTGSLWRIDTAREVATRDGTRRLRYLVTRLDRAAWAELRAEDRVQRFVWNAR